MELVYSIIFLIIGYGFGSFSTGYVVGKMSGHNIQSEGSGNIGTTNALRTMGAKGGALTFAGDLLKAFIPTLLVRFVFCPNMGYSPEMTYLMTLVIGLGVVIGHNFPFYLHFKGGKGIAVSAAVIVASSSNTSLGWIMIGVFLAVFIIVVEITIHEGRNRQVRRMFEYFGFQVHNLRRTQYAFLTLSGVKRGAYRRLTREEVAGLYKYK